MQWYEKLVNRPWKGKPTPPRSFNCGELIRYVYKRRLKIDLPPIYADGANLRQSIMNISQPELYGFEEAVPPDMVRPYDICLLQRNVRRDHVGLVVKTPTGLMFLHCVTGAGVVLETLFEMQATTGCTYAEYRRHKDVPEELALCRG